MICSLVCLLRLMVWSFPGPDPNSLWINPRRQRQLSFKVGKSVRGAPKIVLSHLDELGKVE
jgi:hypothetical protein